MKSIGRMMTCSAARGGFVLAALAALVSPQPAAAQTDVVLLASTAARAGKWVVNTDSTAAGGKSVRHPNAGAAKIATAYASPSNYFELTFNATAGTPYRLWLRGRADGNHYANDSVHVQFSGSVTSSGSPAYRIGTTSSAEVALEGCNGCGLSGWKWQDNGWGKGVLGPAIYFAKTGTQKIRVQTREDGMAVDQVLLSPSTYLKSAPTATNLTGASPPSGATTATDVKLQASSASKAGKWAVYSDSTAVGGKKIRHPNAGAAKVGTAKASPSNYFELTFNAVKGTPYRLWVHGRADGDHYANDSVHVQFSGSVTSSGSPTYRIGTTSSTQVALEGCSGCGLNGWKWEDNGWGKGVLGPAIYFATTGTQKIRVQTREDGLAIDQILLSPSTYLKTQPPQTSGGSAPAPTSPPPSEPAPAPSSTSTLKVLTWNIHHGIGTDGRYDLQRLVSWMVKFNPHVIMITEGEYYTGFGYEDQPQRFKSMLQQQTGKTWYVHHAQEYGNWSAHGKTNILLSRFPFTSTGREVLSYDRSIAAGTINVNGRNITLMTTHWDHQYRSRREQQARDTIAQAKSYAGPHIIGGDFNAWPDQTSIHLMLPVYYDSWAVAAANGLAVSFSGNSPFGATKKGRIDYIFYSRSNSTFLKVLRSQVYDTRNSSGVMPSDHRPLMTTFEVR